jgi:hypothetical protein
MALFKKRNPPEPSKAAELAAKLGDLRAGEKAEAEHSAVKDELDVRIDASMKAKDEAKARIALLEADAANLVRGGDSPEAQKIAEDLGKLHNVVGVHDVVIRAASVQLKAMENADHASKFQRGRIEARQRWFGALRDHLLEQIPEDIKTLICDAQIASAQAGDAQNFPWFCDINLRTQEHRNTERQDRFGNRLDMVAYANRLIEEYES